jgi:hypothetical protein
MPRRPFPPTQRWSTFLRNQALGMGPIGIFQVDWISDQALAFIRCWRSRLLEAAFSRGTNGCSLIKRTSLTSLLRAGRRQHCRAPRAIFSPRGRRVTPYRSRASPATGTLCVFARPSVVAATAMRHSPRPEAGHCLHAAHQRTRAYATQSNTPPS